MVNAALGNLRLKLGERFGLIPENEFAALWVTDFPLLEWEPEEKRWVAMHHPFTSPRNMDDLAADPASLRSCNDSPLSSQRCRQGYHR